MKVALVFLVCGPGTGRADPHWVEVYKHLDGITRSYVSYRYTEGGYKYGGYPIEPFRDLVPLATRPAPAPDGPSGDDGPDRPTSPAE